MSRPPTGWLEGEGPRRRLVLEREFRAPIEDVWAAVTESDRLARWFGTWTGDPASGRVQLTMTAEEGATPGDLEIRECEPPRVLRVTSHFGDESWLLDLTLAESGGVTTLVFAQPDVGADAAPSIGPGWEYYLDRLAAALAGDDVSALDFDDYYPAMAGHYGAEPGAPG